MSFASNIVLYHKAVTLFPSGEIKSLKGGSHSVLPGRVDGTIGGEAISQLWKNKFETILNSVDDLRSKNEFLEKISLLSDTHVTRVTHIELNSIVKNLANNKAVGLDQGSPNYGPRATSGPQLIFKIHTNSSFTSNSQF